VASFKLLPERTKSTTLGTNEYKRKCSTATNYFIHTTLTSHEMTPNRLFAQKCSKGCISTKKCQIEQIPTGHILLHGKEKPQSPLQLSKMISNVWLQLGDYQAISTPIRFYSRERSKNQKL
jgi:hypothetical protein